MNEFEQAVKELLDEDCQLHYEDFAEQCRYLMSMARKVISKEQNNQKKTKKQGVSLERAKQIIVNSDPLLTREIVDRYSESEIKEWCKHLKIATNF